jgi:Putative MetA-pathway of phenol degradation
MKKIIFISGFILSNLVVWGQTDVIVTDRPDITESATIVPVGWLQGEHGFQYNADYFYSFECATTLMRLGINEHTELRFATTPVLTEQPGQIENDLQYTQTFDIGVKSSLYDGDIFQAALIGSFGANYTDAESNNMVLPYFSIIYVGAFNILKFWSLGINAGPSWNEYDNYLQFPYSISNAFALGERCAYFVELFSPDLVDENLWIDAGFTYLINSNFQVDISGGYAFTEEMQFISTGFAYRFEL